MPAIYLSPIATVSIKFLWSKSPTGSYYFKRRVPQDLREQLGKDYIQLCLHTRNLREATKKIEALAKQTDAEWAHMRAPTRSSTISKARELLSDWGIDPGGLEESKEALGHFWDHIEDRLPDEAKHQHWEYTQGLSHEDINLKKYVPEVTLTALQIADGKLDILASDCLDLYQQMRPGTSQATKTARIPFTYLIEHLGDRDIRKYRRADANSFVKYLLDIKKIKTTTVERYITTLRAAWTLVIREHELEDCKNPWQSLEIPKLGEDADTRPPFKIADYKQFYAAIGSPKDDLRAMLILLAETGARLAEIVGLGTDDCVLDNEVPCINIRHRPWRRLKQDSSIRKVPLTPKAQEALKTALDLCKDSAYLFPRYADGKSTNATAASATLNKYIRAQGIDLTVHSLRHGMTDLLRAVRCPEPLRKAIQGWAKADISERYGEGYGLPAMLSELLKATEPLRAV